MSWCSVRSRIRPASMGVLCLSKSHTSCAFRCTACVGVQRREATLVENVLCVHTQAQAVNSHPSPPYVVDCWRGIWLGLTAGSHGSRAQQPSLRDGCPGTTKGADQVRTDWGPETYETFPQFDAMQAAAAQHFRRSLMRPTSQRIVRGLEEFVDQRAADSYPVVGVL